MSTRPLLFVGYSLQDWTFRVLFHGLARDIPTVTTRRHVSVQLMPRVNGSAQTRRRRRRRYLPHYLNGWNIPTSGDRRPILRRAAAEDGRAP